MTRPIIEALYYFSALAMPPWFDWQVIYVMRARAYFECNEQAGFVGWPWRWKLS